VLWSGNMYEIHCMELLIAYYINFNSNEHNVIILPQIYYHQIVSRDNCRDLADFSVSQSCTQSVGLHGRGSAR
jgi:hypothetical protein